MVGARRMPDTTKLLLLASALRARAEEVLTQAEPCARQAPVRRCFESPPGYEITGQFGKHVVEHRTPRRRGGAVDCGRLIP